MPALNEPYQHRACLACGKRIPRWTDGKATPASRVFCGNACGNHYRRRAKGRVTKGVAQNVKKRPINRAPFESVYVTEPRPEYPPCNACGRPYLRTSPAEQFCSARCAEYVPLPPRKPDGEWFIVAGPVDYCDGCGLAVTPRKRQGFLTPVRMMDGHLYCRECRPMRAERKAANNDAAEPIKRAAQRSRLTPRPIRRAAWEGGVT